MARDELPFSESNTNKRKKWAPYPLEHVCPV